METERLLLSAARYSIRMNALHQRASRSDVFAIHADAMAVPFRLHQSKRGDRSEYPDNRPWGQRYPGVLSSGDVLPYRNNGFVQSVQHNNLKNLKRISKRTECTRPIYAEVVVQERQPRDKKATRRRRTGLQL